MYTNRYGNRKAKELNLERIFKKQAQLQPPTSSQVLNISITLNVIQPGPHSPLNNCPTHISYVLSTSYKSFIYQSSMYFLPNIYLSQIKFYFISKFKLLYYSYCIYIPYYNLKFWWLLVRLIQERSPPDLFISINSYRKTVPILKIFDLHGKFPRLH